MPLGVALTWDEYHCEDAIMAGGWWVGAGSVGAGLIRPCARGRGEETVRMVGTGGRASGALATRSRGLLTASPGPPVTPGRAAGSYRQGRMTAKEITMDARLN